MASHHPQPTGLDRYTITLPSQAVTQGPRTYAQDADELSRVPVLGELSQRLRENAPQARRGVSARVDPETGEAIKEDFASGLLAPRVPDRLYIAFQEPIELTPDLVRDRAKADEVRQRALRTYRADDIDDMERGPAQTDA